MMLNPHLTNLLSAECKHHWHTLLSWLAASLEDIVHSAVQYLRSQIRPICAVQLDIRGQQDGFHLTGLQGFAGLSKTTDKAAVLLGVWLWEAKRKKNKMGRRQR